jgi:hypothetical protein
LITVSKRRFLVRRFISTLILGLLLFAAPAPLLAGTLLDEQFDGTALDPSKWTIVWWPAGGVSVGGGVLTLVGDPDYARVITIDRFVPPPGGAVTATARIYVGYGSYQKFGFNPNPTEQPAPGIGLYFDTLETPNTITAQIWRVPGGRTTHQIPLPWGAWYELAIRWTPTDVTYFVDGVSRAQMPAVWSGTLPLGIWNDRGSTMQTDRVRVEISVADFDLDGVNDDLDQCPASILTATVQIDACDSGAPNPLDETGCTLADRIALCRTAARNHGGFVSCVVHLTTEPGIRRCAAHAEP